MSEKLNGYENSARESGAEGLDKVQSFEEHMKNDLPKLSDEQIKEIRRQDKENKKDWKRKQDIISARSQLEQIYAAKERGDETVAIQKGHVKVDGEYVTDEFGQSIPKVDREFVNDASLQAKEQNLSEMEDAYNGGKASWALYKLKKKLGIGRPKGKKGTKHDRALLNDVPKPPEKSN